MHGTEVVLKHANKKKKLVVIASTSEVYGKSTDVPFREDADLVLGPTPSTAGRTRAARRSTSSWRWRTGKRTKLPVIIVAPLQHRRPAPDRPVRHGDPERSSGRRSPASRSRSSATARSRAASPTSATSSARSCSCRRAARGRRGVQHRQRRGGHDPGAGRAGASELTGSRSEIVTIPYEQAYEAGLRGHAAPRAGSSRRSARWSATSPRCDLDEILTDVIDYFQRQ